MLDLLAIDLTKPASPAQTGRKADSNGDFLSELLGANGAAEDDYEPPLGEDLGASDAGTREPAAPEQASPPADEPTRDDPADAAVRDGRTQEAEDPQADRSDTPETATQADNQQNRDGTQTGPDDGNGQAAKPTTGETAATQSPANPATAGDQVLPPTEGQAPAQTAQAPQAASAAATSASMPGRETAPQPTPGTAQTAVPAVEAAPTDATAAAASSAAEATATQAGATTATSEQPGQTPPQATDQTPADALADGSAPSVDPLSTDGGEAAVETTPKAPTTPAQGGDVAPGEAAARTATPEAAAAAQQGTKASDRKASSQNATPGGNGATTAPESGQTGQTPSTGQAAQNAAALAEQLASTTAAGRNFSALVQGMAANGGEAQVPVQSAGGETVPTQFQTQQLTAGGSLDRASGLSGRTAAADPSGQVAVQIQKAVTNKLSRFSISLEPAELGRVDVRLEFVRDGQVRATVSAERPETLELLQKDAQGLERALRDAGANTKELSLSFDLSGDGRREMARNHDGSNASNGDADGESPDGEESIAEQQEPSRRIDGLVDIQV